jgi:DNA-binding transcriptional MerR regulator
MEPGPASEIPPDKLYFRIGEVAKIVGVKPYVLRYWETEFKVIRPGKSPSRQRLYRRKDVETLLRIRALLHDRRFTIEGARQQLRREGDSSRSSRGTSPQSEIGGLERLRELREIREALISLRNSLR